MANRVFALLLLAAVPIWAGFGASGSKRGGPADPGDGAPDGGAAARISPANRTPDDGAADERGERSVQIVYESDTRGYYLPCG